MLRTLTANRLLSIALSIAWIDFVASQMCAQHPRCFMILCPFCLFGLMPVLIAWGLFWIHLRLVKVKAGPGAGGREPDAPRTG